jgi:hypothetical protein
MEKRLSEGLKTHQTMPLRIVAESASSASATNRGKKTHFALGNGFFSQ